MIEDLIDEVIVKEGGYVNDPSDLGGETTWGITIAEARKNGYNGPMQTLPKSFARELYRNRYWSAPGFDKVGAMSMAIGRELFDTGINMGVGKAAEFLQIALNAFNRQEKDYADIGEDCDCGPATRSALASYIAKRGAEGEDVMLKALNCLQGARYIDISRKRAKNEDFTYGWIANRIELGG